MANKIFGVDYANETAPTGTMTLSVDNGSGLVDVELQNLHKALTQATDTQAGTIELANQAEALALSDSLRAITPSLLSYLGIGNGWMPNTATWTYSSADAPSFVISINADVTSILQAGCKIKLTQTTTKYFIVTAVGAFSGGVTLVTVYGGTDYTLANAAISNPFFSCQRAPFGFPLDPDKWTVSLTDTGNRSQASPSAGTWYNVGTLSISIPIGMWRTYYEVTPEIVATPGAAAVYGFKVTLSTANNSESDANMTARKTSSLPAMTGATDRFSTHREKIVNIASKTTHYLNVTTGTAGATSIALRGDDTPTLIRCVCAYL